MYENLKNHMFFKIVQLKYQNITELWQTIQYLCMFETRAPQNQIDT